MDVINDDDCGVTDIRAIELTIFEFTPQHVLKDTILCSKHYKSRIRYNLKNDFRKTSHRIHSW